MSGSREDVRKICIKIYNEKKKRAKRCIKHRKTRGNSAVLKESKSKGKLE